MLVSWESKLISKWLNEALLKCEPNLIIGNSKISITCN